MDFFISIWKIYRKWFDIVLLNWLISWIRFRSTSSRIHLQSNMNSWPHRHACCQVLLTIRNLIFPKSKLRIRTTNDSRWLCNWSFTGKIFFFFWNFDQMMPIMKKIRGNSKYSISSTSSFILFSQITWFDHSVFDCSYESGSAAFPME